MIRKRNSLRTRILVALLAGLPLCGQAQENTLTTLEARSLIKNTTKNRVSVHDPSVVWEPSLKRYYIVGSHRGMAYTTNMQSWTAASWTWKAGTNTNATNAATFVTPKVTKVMKDGAEVALPAFNAHDWSGAYGDWSIDGNLWAPDVIWNEQMQKWCMYMSINGPKWNSSIVLLTADKIIGPYEYQAPVVVTGFNVNSTAGVSYKKMDLETVIGTQASLPSRYNVGGNWGKRWPHAIDPNVFYDQAGNLWMVYGSWSGGLWMLQLDEATGLRDYSVKYPSTGGSTDGVTSDPYFGKKVGGGYYVSGEGAYIEYVGGWYYLFVSYGYLDSTGGYVMRVFRSKNPDGPYTDASNRSAIFTEYKKNYGKNADNRGVKIMGAYNGWGYMTKGELAQGHNSVIAAGDGRTYLVYHTRFNDGTEGHQVRVHQLFQTQNGWLVASPFEYNGETLTDQDIATRQSFTAEEVKGKYSLLVHKYDIDYENREVVTPVEVELRENGTIAGTYNGTWKLTEGTGYVTLKLNNVTYNGVIFEQQMDQKSVKTVSFSALANSGLCVWGYKMHPKYAVAWQVSNQKAPVNNSTKMNRSVDLYGMDLGVENVTLDWSSDQPDIVSDCGKYNPVGLMEDTPVTLTARVSSCNWAWTQSYNVTALSEVNAKATADWESGMLAHYSFDNEPLANTFNATEQAQLLSRGGTQAPSLEDNEPLRNGQVAHLHFGANGYESYVSMPNPLFGKPLTDGATLSFYVKRTDENLWDAFFGFRNGEARLYMTGNVYTGYNNGEGTWLDINHPSTVTTHVLSTGQWHLVTVVFSRTASTLSGGVSVYIDGSLKSNDKFNGSLNGNTITTKQAFDYNYIVDHLSACSEFCLGSGSFWGSPDVMVDDVIFYDRPLSLSEVTALHQMTNRVFYFNQMTTIVDAFHDNENTSADHSVYDLQGRKMDARRWANGQLPKGIYIQHGRKVVVR